MGRGLEEERVIPNTFIIPQGAAFYTGDPSSEYCEEFVAPGELTFQRYDWPPIFRGPRRFGNVFVSGKIVSAEEAAVGWIGWHVYVRPPRGEKAP